MPHDLRADKRVIVIPPGRTIRDFGANLRYPFLSCLLRISVNLFLAASIDPHSYESFCMRAQTNCHEPRSNNVHWSP